MCCKCLAAQNKVVKFRVNRDIDLKVYTPTYLRFSGCRDMDIFTRPTNRLGVGVQVADDQVPRTSHQQDDALLVDRVDNSKVDQWFPYVVSPVKNIIS